MGAGCKKCFRGEIYYDELPSDNISAEGSGLFIAYKYIKNYDKWPIDGGIMKQSAKLMKAIEFMDRICARYDKFDAIKREIEARRGKTGNV